MTLAQSLAFNPYSRWSISFLFVVLLYVVTVLLVINWRISHIAPQASPMGAMTVELAPEPVAPEAPLSTELVARVQHKVSSLPAPEPESAIEPPPKLPLIEKAEAIVAPKAKPLEEKPQPVEESDLQEEVVQEEVVQENVAQEEAAVPDVSTPLVELAAAPMDSALSALPSEATATWQSVLLGHLEKHKRYPRQARRRGQEAIVHIHITLGRDGTVLDYRLIQPSVYATLNRETLALIARAQPLPPPPAEVEGDTVEFVVPVVFSLTS